jgi:hypothetical protein
MLVENFGFIFLILFMVFIFYDVRKKYFFAVFNSKWLFNTYGGV